MTPELKEFFDNNKRVAIGVSGGADSAYLLYAGVSCGADIRPYYVKSAFQPQFELDDAMQLCRDLGVDLTVIELDILTDEAIASNPYKRCYFCKKKIFSALREQAEKDGYSIIIDGTNASDNIEERPGSKAIRELSVKSPLLECGITKEKLREYSKEACLFTWNKPAYACLATRIPTDELITVQKLKNIENAENELFDMGFTDFRVRVDNGLAKLQFKAEQVKYAYAQFHQIKKKLSQYFSRIVIDSVER